MVRRATLALALLLALAGCGSDESADHGQEVYMQRCAACHGTAADAQTPDPEAPNLFGTSLSTEQVQSAVAEGRPGMPKDLADPAEVAAAVAYLTGQSG